MIERDMFGGRRSEYIIPTGAFVAKCASCKADIVWTVTHKSKSIPLSLATVEERDGVRYALAHFVDCPDSAAWSGKGRKR